MTRDIYTIAWKEWQEYLHQERGRRLGPLRGTVFVTLGGAFVGWQLDPDFGRSALTVVLTTLLSVMFVTTVVPDSFAGERERHTLETLLASRLPDRAIVLGKVAAATSYGWAISAAVLPVGIVFANLLHGSPGLPWFDGGILLASLGLSLLTGLLIAAIGVQLSLYAPTARQAHQRLGFVILGLFMTPALLIPALPEIWREALVENVDAVGLPAIAMVALVALMLLNLGLLTAALLRFHRARLIV
jgi:ABC-2 type transport system permease protein